MSLLCLLTQQSQLTFLNIKLLSVISSGPSRLLPSPFLEINLLPTSLFFSDSIAFWCVSKERTMDSGSLHRRTVSLTLLPAPDPYRDLLDLLRRSKTTTTTMTTTKNSPPAIPPAMTAVLDEPAGTGPPEVGGAEGPRVTGDETGNIEEESMRNLSVECLETDCRDSKAEDVSTKAAELVATEDILLEL